MRSRDLLRVVLLTISLLVNVAIAAAATVPAGFTDTLIASGLSNPTAMALAPDGRIFVCQQNGQLRVIKNGALLATPFLTVTVDSSGERGLLGVAFDPNFVSNQLVYIYYTATTPAVRDRSVKGRGRCGRAACGCRSSPAGRGRSPPAVSAASPP